MKTVATVNAVIFTIVFAVAIYIGVDPKKWQSWLLGVYGFMTFLLVGMVGTGNVYEAVKLGAIFMFVAMFTGVTTYWTRERAKKWLKEHGENYE